MATREDQASESRSHDLFLACLPIIDAVLAAIVRRHHLNAADAEDFASIVRIKLLADDCAVLRRFQQRSSMKTYLTTVIQRLHLDYRISSWGKWRPSAEARRAGALAMLLERLITRDGLSFEDACSTLLITHKVQRPRRELEDLYGRLPARTRRRIINDDATLETLPAKDDLEREASIRAFQDRRKDLGEKLRQVIEEQPTEDRLILRLKFEQGLTVAETARALGLPQQRLYRRIEDMLRTLRTRLEQLGFDGPSILEGLGDSLVPMESVFGADEANRDQRPSIKTAGPGSERFGDRG